MYSYALGAAAAFLPPFLPFAFFGDRFLAPPAFFAFFARGLRTPAALAAFGAFAFAALRAAISIVCE